MGKGKKQRYYTLMVVPHDAHGKPWSIKIPALWVYTTLSVMFFFVLVVSSSIVYSTLLSRRLVNYTQILTENQRQEKVIAYFSQKTEKVNQAIQELVKEDNRLRKLLGLKNWKSKMKLSSNIDLPEASEAQKVSQELVVVGKKISERRQSLKELKNWVSYVGKRFAGTPSIWPVYGRISSRFGYRVRPWRGFHSGVDIKATYGRSVRAAAGGIVTYAGWRKGYGRTVMINHRHSLVTLYGHNSKLLVSVGQRIKKGQVIARVGNTGYSTGSHVHYEVRKYGTAVNPVNYLNLSILTASRLWR